MRTPDRRLVKPMIVVLAVIGTAQHAKAQICPQIICPVTGNRILPWGPGGITTDAQAGACGFSYGHVQSTWSGPRIYGFCPGGGGNLARNGNVCAEKHAVSSTAFCASTTAPFAYFFASGLPNGYIEFTVPPPYREIEVIFDDTHAFRHNDGGQEAASIRRNGVVIESFRQCRACPTTVRSPASPGDVFRLTEFSILAIYNVTLIVQPTVSSVQSTVSCTVVPACSLPPTAAPNTRRPVAPPTTLPTRHPCLAGASVCDSASTFCSPALPLGSSGYTCLCLSGYEPIAGSHSTCRRVTAAPSTMPSPNPVATPTTAPTTAPTNPTVPSVVPTFMPSGGPIEMTAPTVRLTPIQPTSEPTNPTAGTRSDVTPQNIVHGDPEWVWVPLVVLATVVVIVMVVGVWYWWKYIVKSRSAGPTSRDSFNNVTYETNPTKNPTDDSYDWDPEMYAT